MGEVGCERGRVWEGYGVGGVGCGRGRVWEGVGCGRG